MPHRPPDPQWRGFGITFLRAWLLANAWSLATNAQQQHQQDSQQIKIKDDAASYASDVRAIAPYAPAARASDAVRAPANPVASSTAGLSSRLPARSLQDWKVEDVVLLATVDGMIHATDRNTGTELWALEADKAMVETIYHPRNRSILIGLQDPTTSDFLWIVEPSQDGQLYGYTPGMPLGMQKLGLSVKELIELSPYSSDDPPVVYTGEKKNTLYTIDIATGNILQVFSATHSSMNPNSDVCRKVDELDALDDDKCGATGTLTLTRTEYIVGVTSKATGEQISTIVYSEWGPNNRDKDLFGQYSTTKGDRYIHSRHNGEVIALDNRLISGDEKRIRPTPKYRHKFSSPVARVFDVARPLYSTALDTPLVILPQPQNPSYDESNANVFVNCTDNGSWYAMSEKLYPLVTRGAGEAQCMHQDWIFSIPDSTTSLDLVLKEALVGVHALSLDDTQSPMSRIGGPPVRHTLENPRAQRNSASEHLPAVPGDGRLPDLPSASTSSRLTSILLLLIVALGSGFWYKKAPHVNPLSFLNSGKIASTRPKPDLSRTASIDAPTVAMEDPLKVALKDGTSPRESVRFEEPDRSLEPVVDDQRAQPEIGETAKQKKKPAHRGRRGGKREAERKKQASDEVELNGVLAQGKENVSVKPDIVYQTNSTTPGAPAGLMNLEIQSDTVLGQGSGGTIVFGGKFEGRDVAVKRMLGQYSELASQEVTLLEQSEEHPNVIRYFCRRQDEHFLYIALELCQASLWDLFRDGRMDEVSERHRPLANNIRQRPDKVLRQLAEGLKHLHNFRIVHRDIKPQNMLIAYPKSLTAATFPRLVISDFGLCKTLPPNASTLIGATISAGTTGWKAPELIYQPRDFVNGATNSTGGRSDAANGESTQGVKRAVDIFSLGCVFFYVFTGGKHPFDDDEGWMGIRERNIKANRCNLQELEKYQSHDIKDLICWMLSPQPEERPTASEVLAHPFFWSSEDKLEFLSLASDRFDVEARDGSSLALKTLEDKAVSVIGEGPRKVTYGGSGMNSVLHHRSASGQSSHPPAKYEWNMVMPGEPNFLAALDKKFVDTLGKQRKYQGYKLVDLLRALRNKHHHWDDMPDDVKARVGSVPEGYYNYWEQRFPGLLVAVWTVVKEVGMSEDGRFDRWFKRRMSPVE